MFFDLDKTLPEFMPQKSHLDDAGYDLKTTEDFILFPEERRLIPTGAYLNMADLGLIYPYPTDGLISFSPMGLICPRSGLANKYGISVVNSPGVIDKSFIGELKVNLINLGKDWVRFNRGDRIAQIMFTTNLVLTNEFRKGNSGRGTSGHGSTGVL